ncbi:hypothetical protein [Bacteroides clarus]|jgi:hypothetical protein|uniref:hypothetical protein n=1 Tax=Bacteroides clarus TaxID=626929 RepID=UPI0011DDA2B6|nr:hypothetical protein [Bacteroides clarus]
MKQTVEEAAKEYSSQWAWNSQPDMWQSEKDFKAGAEWQAKQSPWVSVEERLPEDSKLVLCRMVSNGAIVSGFIIPTPSGQPRVVTLPDFEFEDYGNYVCDMWMPIPSFDQILEANKDVLQRMKEKGETK